ncbi:hypothetical protein M9H77_13884 [Catharanthus roseus]|uniref:Uncharacterized protein n=1 Tax=Catharanthus roseus TaxID=4058 RepID=A0ACC0BLF8_CATRO|nr:hypothetical protein M9H77_13884 [Catharanthus roseus]
MHRSGAPYRRCLIISGYNSDYDHVFGSVRGLHCTWLVSHTRTSSDGVDVSDSGEWINLKGAVVPQRAWPNRSMWTLYYALRWDNRLVESQEGLETKKSLRYTHTHVDSLSVHAHAFHIMFPPQINSGQTEARPEPVVKSSQQVHRVVGVDQNQA